MLGKKEIKETEWWCRKGKGKLKVMDLAEWKNEKGNREVDWWPSGSVVSTADPRRAGTFVCRVCTFSRCLSGFSQVHRCLSHQNMCGMLEVSAPDRDMGVPVHCMQLISACSAVKMHPRICFVWVLLTLPSVSLSVLAQPPWDLQSVDLPSLLV